MLELKAGYKGGTTSFWEFHLGQPRILEDENRNDFPCYWRLGIPWWPYRTHCLIRWTIAVFKLKILVLYWQMTIERLKDNTFQWKIFNQYGLMISGSHIWGGLFKNGVNIFIKQFWRKREYRWTPASLPIIPLHYHSYLKVMWSGRFDHVSPDCSTFMPIALANGHSCLPLSSRTFLLPPRNFTQIILSAVVLRRPSSESKIPGIIRKVQKYRGFTDYSDLLSLLDWL